MLTFEDFLTLVAEVDAVRQELRLDVMLEGYSPPSSPNLYRFSVAPDPGVLEVNIPPTTGTRDYVELMEAVYEAVLHAGLHCEKYLIDGRMQGSGGGHHLTLGGVTAQTSPFLQRPDLLASLLTFNQHHPCLSYMFAGLFVGPTSEHPRVDEARHETLYELEIALNRAFDRSLPTPPWLADLLFRNLLVDMTGNTHRSEISVDKLFDPVSPWGRQGILEFRSFEMPPHVRMACAQMILVRAMVAAFVDQPYRAPLVRWGQTLHDRFLLPFWMWRDFEDVLGELARRRVQLDPAIYRPFVDLRCPVVGRMAAGDVVVEVRNAIEPWYVLGEEITAHGTSRYVDSSVERIEVRVDGLVPERYQVLVNGQQLPLRATGQAQEYVGGVRFRAWAPPHSLHAHLGIHHPLRIDLVDTWGKRSVAACAYHVWHAEGRSFDEATLTRYEASARRAQRFTVAAPMMRPAVGRASVALRDVPYSLDLRTLGMDHPMPEPEKKTT
jgi:uncharacterized protein (DUF2126 family)